MQMCPNHLADSVEQTNHSQANFSGKQRERRAPIASGGSAGQHPHLSLTCRLHNTATFRHPSAQRQSTHTHKHTDTERVASAGPDKPSKPSKPRGEEARKRESGCQATNTHLPASRERKAESAEAAELIAVIAGATAKPNQSNEQQGHFNKEEENNNNNNSTTNQEKISPSSSRPI